MIGSPERLRGVYYDYDKMEFMGITLDDRRKGYFQYGDVSRSIGQIPVPRF